MAKRAPVYTIREDYMAGVVAKAVAIFKQQNPHVGRAKFTCNDGSTVDVRIRDEKAKAECVKLSERRRTHAT